MIKNYFKIAFRLLWKYKLFSFINIFGLASGMAFCVLALIDCKKAFDWDTFHPFPDRTYRIITDVTYTGNKVQSFASTPFPVGDNLQQDYPFVETTVRAIRVAGVTYDGGEKHLPATTFFTNAGFLKIFGFPLLKGSFSNEPRTIVVTEETAQRFFGRMDAIGKTLHHKDWGDFIVTGVLKTPVKKSHLVFDALASLATVPVLPNSGKGITEIGDWTNPWSCYTYVLLKKGTPVSLLGKVMPSLAKTATDAIHSGTDEKSLAFRAQPLNQITPSREDLLNFAGGTTIGKLLVQIGIALLLLLLAGFNYINLTLARSLTRAKEVGVRKVAGANRQQVYFQFIVESVVVAFMAMALAVVVLQLMKPLAFMQGAFDGTESDIGLWMGLVGFTILTGLVAGSLPAKILSAFQPVLVLKGQKGIITIRKFSFRKVLMVIQFTISLTGIIVMLVIYKQQLFMAKGEYGFTKENILNLPLADSNYSVLLNELSHINGVEQTSATSATLGTNAAGWDKIFSADKDVYTAAVLLSADQHFIDIMGLSLVAGTNMPVTNTDSAGHMVLVNERMAQGLHFKNAQQMVGQLIWLNDSTQVRIAGVLKDFHSNSMFFPITPFVIYYQPKEFQTLQVKVSSRISRALIKDKIKAVYTQVYPHQPLNSEWFDEQLYNRNFHGDDQLLLGLLCGTVLSIACLGLLGMVTYTSQVRTKEVGIRKVLGASVGQLILLLSGNFLLLLLLAAFIALPVGYIAGSLFLQNFAYHISIDAGTLLIGFVILFITGGLTIGWQTFRVAIHNPVRSLRTE